MRAPGHRFCAAILLAMSVIYGRVLVAQAVPTAIGPGSSIRVGGGVSAYHLDYGQRWLGGAHGWVDVNPTWRIGIEGEARRLRYNQDLNTHATTYLVGPRISLLPTPIEPYVKVLAGSGRFSFPYNYARGNYLVVAAGGGVDLHLGDRVQVRLIDVEYQRWPQFTFGSMAPYGISAGVSYAIHRGETWYVR